MLMKHIIVEPPKAQCPSPVKRRTLADRMLVSNRWVLGGAILFAVLLPALLAPYAAGWGRFFTATRAELVTSMIASALAVTAIHVALQQMTSLPLVTAKALIIPTTIAAYTFAIVALEIAQFDKSPYLFWTGCILTIIWYGLISTMRTRRIVPVVGFVGPLIDELVGDVRNVEWRELTAPVLEGAVDAVVVDPHAELSLEWSSFVTGLVLNGVPVYHLAHFREGITGRVRFRSDADNNFGSLLPSSAYLRIKRVLDLFGLVVGVVFASPVLAIAAMAIKLDSPGPILFRQTRIGHRGQPFECYKLRTMTHNASGLAYTLANDPRITRVGMILRKWRIDELPQMLNILKGEMSWIGPRPEALSLAQSYSQAVAYYDYRHAVRPGITGWAAVHQGNVAEAEAARVKLEYDFFYIRHFSIWLDALICLKTVQTVWNGFGAK